VPEYLPRSATFLYTTLRFQQRFLPLVLTKRTANLDEFPLEGPVVDLGAGKRRDAYPKAIAAEVGRRGCVAIHAHFGWSGPPSLPASRRHRIPLVTTFYGRDLAEQKRRLSLRHPYESLFRDGELFVCEGPAMASALAGIGCPRDRIRIVKIGLDLELFAYRPRERSAPLVLIQIARLVEKKGVDVSLRAFALAERRLGKAELWIVGDGPLRAKLEAFADELGLRNMVRFLGERTHAECRELSARAHICLQPSRIAADGDTEGGAPTVLLEMQASGVAVAATRHADIPAVVAADDCLVKEDDAQGFADTVVQLAQFPDAEWRDRLDRARTYVEAAHDARVIADALESVYLEAIGGAACR
jgi:colanic acid/amylovoran biosynthesis glycosyltransferase